MADEAIDTTSPEYQAGYRQGIQEGEQRGHARALRTVRNRLGPLLADEAAASVTDDMVQLEPSLPPDTAIHRIGLPVRISNTLNRSGKYTVASVLDMTNDDLLDIFGMGPQLISDLDAVLASIGYRRHRQ